MIFHHVAAFSKSARRKLIILNNSYWFIQEYLFYVSSSENTDDTYCTLWSQRDDVQYILLCYRYSPTDLCAISDALQLTVGVGQNGASFLQRFNDVRFAVHVCPHKEVHSTVGRLGLQKRHIKISRLIVEVLHYNHIPLHEKRSLKTPSDTDCLVVLKIQTKLRRVRRTTWYTTSGAPPECCYKIVNTL